MSQETADYDHLIGKRVVWTADAIKGFRFSSPTEKLEDCVVLRTSGHMAYFDDGGCCDARNLDLAPTQPCNPCKHQRIGSGYDGDHRHRPGMWCQDCDEPVTFLVVLDESRRGLFPQKAGEKK